MNQWFTSDPHLGHKNIVRGISTWKNKSACREFDTLEEHDNTIVNAFNKYVAEDDIVFLLGDFSLGGAENVYKYRKQLACKNIHYILGNHCHHIANNKHLVIDEEHIRLQDLFRSVNQILIK